MGRGRDLAYGAAAVVSAPVWIPLALAKGFHKSGWRHRFGSVSLPPPDGRPRVLLHAVSVGEVASVAGLVPRMLEAGFDVAVSTTTDTGLARAEALVRSMSVEGGASVPVVRFPFDWSGSVRRFLDAVRPDLVGLVELELWPNFVDECVDRDIPVVVVGGRISARSAPRYARLKPVLGPTFRKLTAVGAQSKEYADRFVALGTPRERVTVTDSLKWDAVEVVDAMPGAEELAAALGIDPSKPLVVAGSTGPGEEAALTAHWPDDVQLLLAPRKPERFGEVARLLPSAVRRSVGSSSATGGPLFILDSIGELSAAYSLADVAIVGRSTNGMGGSNPIEPAALGCAVLIGPDHGNFSEPVRVIEAAGGLRVVQPDRIATAAVDLARAPEAARAMASKAQAAVVASQGATDRTVSVVRRALAGPNDGQP